MQWCWLLTLTVPGSCTSVSLSGFLMRAAEVMIQVAEASWATTVPVQAKVFGASPSAQFEIARVRGNTLRLTDTHRYSAKAARNYLPVEAAMDTTDLDTLSAASLALKPSALKSSSSSELFLSSSEEEEGDGGQEGSGAGSGEPVPWPNRKDTTRAAARSERKKKIS